MHGGKIVAEGKPADIMRSARSLTGQYLSGKRGVAIPKKRHAVNPEKRLILRGAQGNNLKKITVEVPLGLMTCVTGVSGSGKSTLINDTLAPIVARALNGMGGREPAPYDEVEGLEYLDKVVVIDQSPITPRFNPATYTGPLPPFKNICWRA